MALSAPPPQPSPAAGPTRSFGRFSLLKLLGKSVGTTAWLAFDPRLGQEVMISVPRVQPFDGVALELWSREARKAARLVHPNLAPVLEIGLQDKWPFVVVERQLGVTLAEWLQARPPAAPLESVGWLCQALEGLAFAHESGCSHNDLQPHNLLVNEQGKLCLMALSTAGDMSALEEARGNTPAEATSAPALADQHGLIALRRAGERDVLACGVLLHRLLSGQPPLEQPDVARVMARIAPLGRELVHLPWTTPHPVPAALRAIANRSTASQERQRYLNARTLLRALNGWQQTQSEDNGGPLVLLLDRLRTVGHLPAQPGLAAKVERLVARDGEHTETMVAELLQDMALSLELLRQVNSALVRNTQTAGGAVLTLRRSVALLGVNGVRQAANGLRRWPGPLSDAGAAGLKRLMDRVRLAGHVAQALRPAGYDPEVVYLVTLLQNLGRLMIQYHFPDEADQIRQLTLRPEPSGGSPPAEVSDAQAMTEAAASFAVLGVDLDEVGAAVARHWGLGPELQQMIRRQPAGERVRSVQSDVDALGKTASAANEVVDAIGLLPPAQAARALDGVAQRYARALRISTRDVKDAIQSARETVRHGGVARPRDAGGQNDNGMPEAGADGQAMPASRAPSQPTGPAPLVA